jgi:hypothetical protein
MDAFFHSLLAVRIVFIFSILNIVLGVLVLLSCRCIPGSSYFRGILQNKKYLSLYKFHCWLWLIFFVPITIHAILAINVFGVPF